MRIARLTLPSSDVDACVAFYRDVMQFRVSGTRIHVGWTVIDVVPDGDFDGAVHLAFTVPRHRFEAAAEWLASRAMLLRDPMGEERFHLDGAWQSDSVYFAGPHGAVLELIGRRALVSGSSRIGAFHGGEILCLSEVGLPTDDVLSLADALSAQFGLHALGDTSDVFAPMGDHEGLLIVVDGGRPWFPELRQLPGGKGLRVTLEGVTASEPLRNAYGWEVTSATLAADAAHVRWKVF